MPEQQTKTMNLFKLVLNNSDSRRAFFMSNGNPFDLYPQSVFDHALLGFSKRDYLSPVSNFLNMINEKDIKKFYIQRTFALGDVLMLVPVIRYLNKRYDCYLRTNGRFRSILERLGIKVQDTIKEPSGYGLLLDGTIERDHVDSKLQKFHRMDLYFNAVGVDSPDELDWSCKLESFPDAFLNEPYIVFQGLGSGPRKSLQENEINKLIKLLNKADIRVVVIGGNEGVISEKCYDKARCFFKQLAIPQLFSLIAGAKCVVCMDSSPLWISHFTSTPVVALLGASRAEQRIVKHPLYPEGAVAIELSKEVGCKPCFESAEACSGKRSCLALSAEKIYNLIYSHIERYYG